MRFSILKEQEAIETNLQHELCSPFHLHHRQMSKFNNNNNVIQFESGLQESMNLQELFVRKVSWNPRHLQSCQSCLGSRDCADNHMCGERQSLLRKF